jgi:hypothetical protein
LILSRFFAETLQQLDQHDFIERELSLPQHRQRPYKLTMNDAPKKAVVRPEENRFIESSNRKLRDELLNVEPFDTLRVA